MEGDDAPPPIRLMNFVSEDQLAEARKTRGARVEDGTAQRDRPLFEILKENKDKKDAEFNERFKHRPPKALDEDETEFLDKLDMSKREYERQVAEEEEQHLRSFQAAVESQYNVVHELKETPSAPKDQDKTPLVGKKNPRSRGLGMVIKVKPQAKKAKVESRVPEEKPSAMVKTHDSSDGREPGRSEKVDRASEKMGTSDVVVATSGLVSYSDDSEDDE
ncbi:NEFA-interacting nuclear protein [Perilla frutescens var. hirtella]|uniref:NEFA-interacting nuclear protein n=1 Tax=Perilla frutescens var. hirtella TaxID=608512 RepID=A0AAD4P4G6_PERFH|nr:NEFA-interacting nuclear protein [Perilla frutescens var. hirtella]